MFNDRKKISDILRSGKDNYSDTIIGWVRTFRNSQFISLNDGSTIKNFQIVVDSRVISQDIIKHIVVGACLKIHGKIVKSLGKGQTLEMVAKQIDILGSSDAESYPIQPKKHSLEFLREHGHLRMRTTTFQSIMRVRHQISYAIHEFFHSKEFVYFHSPILTSSDCEGAGEMFTVTSFDLEKTKEIDFTKDFFAKKTHLTVSGQLQGELAVLGAGLSEIYTFGPTFRAENSNTTRHLAEFWMVEPEMAFYDIEDNMNLAEAFLKYIIAKVLKNNNEELEFLNNRLIQENKTKPANERLDFDLFEKLEFCLNNDFERITYSQAIDILLNSKPHKKKKFQYKVEWGIDLQSEHERYLVEKHFKKPVIIIDYPKDIKAFYMRVNDDDKTVAAMDILFPGIGEIVGGSQREEREDILMHRMKESDINAEEMKWYLDTRKFGSCVHSGFGLGLERLILFITGMTNIRDVIPFPRYPRGIAF